MDVILDANIFLSDLKFQGTHFAELFAYLRRTGDSLVVPTVVMEEVLERYKDRLRDDLNRAKSSWVRLAATKITSHASFPQLDLDKEVQSYRQQLLSPAQGVAVLQYADVSEIDINEIARRGIRRKKPASDTGEELRDVFLWFLVFQYAKKEHRQVAFISGDNVFRKSKDEDGLHPDLASEIVGSNLSIHFYREVAAFLTSQSLSQKPVGQDWFSRFVNVSELSKGIADAISATRTRHGWPHDVSNDGPEFAEGTAYEISQDSVYAELKYVGRTRLFFKQLGIINHLLIDAPFSESTVNVYLPSAMGDWLEASRKAGATKITAKIDDKQATSAFVVTGGSVDLGPKLELTNLPFRKFDVLFDFEAWLSARVEKEKLVSWQVDHINLVEAK